MARRDSDYSRVRRIADRGNGIDGLDSRARGGDRRPVRRTADRGNDGVDSDPRDIKIMRLQRRVRDLELQHEIMRLKKRIHDLEASPVWEETEPEEPVGGELTGDEEHPTHGRFIYHSPPYFDNYEDEEVSQEDYLWVTKALNGEDDKEKDVADNKSGKCFPHVMINRSIVGQYMHVKTANKEYDEDVICDICAYNSFEETRFLAWGSGNQWDGQWVVNRETSLGSSTEQLAPIESKAIESSILAMAPGGSVGANFGVGSAGDGEPVIETPIMVPTILDDLNSKIQNGEKIMGVKNLGKDADNYDNNAKLPNEMVSQNNMSECAMYKEVTKLIILDDKYEIVENFVHMHDLDGRNTRGHQGCILNNANGYDNLTCGQEINSHDGLIDSGAYLFRLNQITNVTKVKNGGGWHGLSNMVIELSFKPNGGKVSGDHKQIKKGSWAFGVETLRVELKTLNIPFDPGGFNS